MVKNINGVNAEVGSFKDGMVCEFTAQKCSNGVKSFNLENLIGTLIHATAGYFAGWGLRKAIKPNYKGIFVKD